MCRSKSYFVNKISNKQIRQFLECFSLIALAALFILLPEYAFAQSVARCNGPDGCIARGVCNVLGLVTGSFGAVVMSAAGVISLLSAAMGMYRTTISVIVVGAGSYLLEPMINLFYGFPVCRGWSSSFQTLPMGM